MKPSRFTQEQMFAILREQEAGAATADVCRKHGISSATSYKWKAKYGGLEVSNAKRLRDELLNETQFTSLAQVRAVLNALGNLTPTEFAACSAPGPQRGGALRYTMGSASRPVAPPSPVGSNVTGTLPLPDEPRGSDHQSHSPSEISVTNSGTVDPVSRQSPYPTPGTTGHFCCAR
jgi:putative transposase